MGEKTKIPAVRFRGFSTDWEERRIGDILSIAERPINMLDDKTYQLVTVKRRNEGIVSRGFVKGKNILVKNYFEIKDGDFLISKRQVIHGANGYVPKNLNNAVVSNEYMVAISNENISTKFWTLISHRKEMYKLYLLSSYGVDIEKMVFNVDDWRKRSIIIPNLKEQEKIIEFFEHLDKLISLHQKKHTQLMTLKKAMLEKMFPKEGETVPEIRFAGFTEPWQRYKISKIADRYDNLRVPVAANLRIPGTTPYYGANGIQDYVEGFTHEGEFILVAEDGANDLKNYPVKYVCGRIWVNNHAHVLQGKPRIADNRFLSYAISQTDIEALLVGGGRAKLNAEVMMQIALNIPDKIEQKKIGQYFHNLDNLITLQQQKIDQLQHIKKAFLDKMFV